jgi:hypothetical protein
MSSCTIKTMENIYEDISIVKIHQRSLYLCLFYLSFYKDLWLFYYINFSILFIITFKVQILFISICFQDSFRFNIELFSDYKQISMGQIFDAWFIYKFDREGADRSKTKSKSEFLCMMMQQRISNNKAAFDDDEIFMSSRYIY